MITQKQYERDLLWTDNSTMKTDKTLFKTDGSEKLPEDKTMDRNTFSLVNYSQQPGVSGCA
jgi:hypothetical protein